jgi:hypothetical protein
LGQADSPRHAFGVFAKLPAAGPVQPDHFDQLVRPLLADRGGHVEQPAVESQRFLDVANLQRHMIETHDARLARICHEPAPLLSAQEVGGRTPLHK